MITKAFRNELGNRIKIKVKSYRGEHISKDSERKKYVGVSVALIGPTSMSENQITVMEARELHAALGEYLGGLPSTPTL